MKLHSLLQQVVMAFTGTAGTGPDPQYSGDEKAKEVDRFVEQTGGSHLVIDPSKGEVVSFTSAGPDMPELQKALALQLAHEPSLNLEAELIETVEALTQSLAPENGLDGLVMQTEAQPGAGMAELAPAAGIKQGIAHMFFDNAAERGLASAMRIQTVVMWQEPDTEMLHIASSPENLNTMDTGFNNAFQERSELVMLPLGHQTAVLGSKFSGGVRQMTGQPVPGLADGVELTSGSMTELPTPGPGNPLEDMLKGMLRKNKRKLAEDEEELRHMRPGA